jgi:adenylosuccinate synthase
MAAASTELQHGAVITRDAHVALRDLKALVDHATEELHEAELQTVDSAIGRTPRDNPRRTVLAAADTLRSSKFESALQRAKAALESAVAWHSPKEKAANSH